MVENENNEENILIKIVSYEYKSWLVRDLKYKKGTKYFWINEIRKNGKIISRKNEKSDRDKTVEDLKIEFYEFYAEKRF